MSFTGFHIRGTGKRRGDNLPACLRYVARRGATLIELLIAMLILAIVCVSWLEIIGIQSARKEARRRESVDRLSGLMDAFMYMNKSSVTEGSYHFDLNESINQLLFSKDSGTNVVHAIFEPDVSPVGYQLLVVKKAALNNHERFESWWDSKKWLVGRLYERNGTIDEAGKSFFTLQVYLGL